MTPRGARIAALVLAIALGQFLYLRYHEAWSSYWLLKDSQKGTATILGDHWSGHNSVDYKYAVNGKDYIGHDSRTAQTGQESTVYFSASHPWISRLSMPRTILEGAPIVLIVLVLELFAIITIVNPTSGWAFSLLEREKKNGA